MKDLSSAKVIEYVTFLAKKAVLDIDMVESIKNTNQVLNNVPGFIHRYIAKQDDGKWVEVVFWESKKQAKEGLELFLNNPKSIGFLDKILDGSVRIEYSCVMDIKTDSDTEIV